MIKITISKETIARSIADGCFDMLPIINIFTINNMTRRMTASKLKYILYQHRKYNISYIGNYTTNMWCNNNIGIGN